MRFMSYTLKNNLFFHYLCDGEPTNSYYVLLITKDVYYNDITMNPTDTTEDGYYALK